MTSEPTPIDPEDVYGDNQQEAPRYDLSESGFEEIRLPGETKHNQKNGRLQY